MLTDPSRWESLKTGSLCPLFIAITQQLITVFSAFVEFEQETCLYGYPDRKFLPRGPLPMGGIRSSQSISCRSQVNLKKPESKKDGTPFTPFHGRKSHTRALPQNGRGSFILSLDGWRPLHKWFARISQLLGSRGPRLKLKSPMPEQQGKLDLNLELGGT
eukprot:600819-Rhodomonas_salina.2